MEPTKHQMESLGKAKAEFSERWNCIHNPFPNCLHHYTSASGLIGILSSKSFWLTDLRYMNDMSELQYAQQVIERCISEKLYDSNLSSIQKEFLSRISKSYSPFESGASVYSASFCEIGNLLSQWRSYRGYGGGYAIGFDFFHAMRLLNKQCVLRKVIYDEKEQINLVREVVASLVKAVGDATTGDQLENVSNTFLPTACQTFSGLAGELMFCLKHPDFHEEREWRLVHFSRHTSPVERNTSSPHFREFQGNIIPYHSVSFEAAIDASNNDLSGIGFPIRKLTIGPTISSDLNEQSLRALMYSLSKDIEPRIEKSEIPLRWL
ncbi:DUF2971 domain-containing protein [Salinicola sp. CR57]|uniref:DUF2971 domain-containing protein n=1 Tax=Salinicola sp. CR57 TaxID=1949086 RepID=UPI000DA1E472|nr:DUF2971 domain-containing protein [Salinicola sp. CR57]